MYTKDDVAKLLSDIDALKFDPPLLIGDQLSFGLEVDLFDPVSGLIITACRPHRPDIGETEIMLTPTQVASNVAGMRFAKLQSDRAAGVAFLDPQDNADAKAAVAQVAADDANRAQDAADTSKQKAQVAADVAKAAQADADKAKTAQASDPQKNADAKAAVAKTAADDAAKAQAAANAAPGDAALAQAAKDAKARSDTAAAEAKTAKTAADAAKAKPATKAAA